MACLLQKSSVLTFTICANRLPRHEGQLTTFKHFDRRLRECSLATLRWIVVSTGGATDSQKLSMNFLKKKEKKDVVVQSKSGPPQGHAASIRLVKPLKPTSKTSNCHHRKRDPVNKPKVLWPTVWFLSCVCTSCMFYSFAGVDAGDARLYF
jgi:hypothetical protein